MFEKVTDCFNMITSVYVPILSVFYIAKESTCVDTHMHSHTHRHAASMQKGTKRRSSGVKRLGLSVWSSVVMWPQKNYLICSFFNVFIGKIGKRIIPSSTSIRKIQSWVKIYKVLRLVLNIVRAY